jgi:hypothetical protein
MIVNLFVLASVAGVCIRAGFGPCFTSATTTQLLSSGEFCKLHYDTIPDVGETLHHSIFHKKIQQDATVYQNFYFIFI